MQRYIFSASGSGIPDSTETETFADAEAAWHEATQLAGEIFKDVDGNFRPGQSWKLEVQDEQGHVLFSIDVTSKDYRSSHSKA